MGHFAIVIPNLNQSRFLPDALESLKHQSVPFDLALMDGGSVDGFDRVARKYRDMIACLRSGPDGGQARAIAQGLEKISGDMVSWLNADDYYFPGALGKVAAVFENHPEIDVVYGDAVHVKPDGAFISYFPAIEAFNPGILPFSCFICQPACFVRRAALDAAGGINPALTYTMDWDLWCRLAAGGARFYYLQDALAAVRYYPETKTLSGDRRRYHEIWRIGKKYGGRRLPVSWPGFYRFDLSFKQNKTPGEKLAVKALDGLRYLKKRVRKAPRKTLYGFYPWRPVVDGRCRIQFPWYGDKSPEGLVLRVHPPDGEFQVNMGPALSCRLRAEGGVLRVPLSRSAAPCYQIDMACLNAREWEMTDCSFENQDMTQTVNHG